MLRMSQSVEEREGTPRKVNTKRYFGPKLGSKDVNSPRELPFMDFRAEAGYCWYIRMSTGIMCWAQRTYIGEAIWAHIIYIYVLFGSQQDCFRGKKS